MLAGSLLLGIVLFVLPIALGISGIKVAGGVSGLLMAMGLVITISAMALLAFSKFYRKTRPSESIVLRGMKTTVVIRDGGTFVIPILHEVTVVPLHQVRLVVDRRNENALLTSDKMRADICVEFFVRIHDNEETIKNAARSFHNISEDFERACNDLVQDKLVSAIRTVAATKTLEELNSNREAFKKDIMNAVKEDLDVTGLVLDSATISVLDQTAVANLRAGNVFDAQGARYAAQITEEQLTEKNRIEKEAEEKRARQDVETRKRILELEREQAEFEASQAAQVKTIQAEQARISREKELETEREIAVAQVRRQQAEEVAQVERQKAQEVSQREKEKAVEVAEREKQQAIALAEAKKAQAAAERARAEAEAALEEERVTTVRVQETADRQKRQQIIEAEAKAQKDLIAAKQEVDAEAYKTERDAEAKEIAAIKEASATVHAAEAEKDAKMLQVEADRAAQMIPVEVDERKVAVAKKRVDEVEAKELDLRRLELETVKIPDLQAREAHGKVAQDFELRQREIEAEKEVRIAAANAIAAQMGNIDMTLFGSASDAGRMINSMMIGMGLAKNIEGFKEGASPETVESILGGINSLQSLVGGLAGQFGIRTPTREVTVEKPVVNSDKAAAT